MQKRFGLLTCFLIAAFSAILLFQTGMKAARAEEPVVKELTLIVYMCGSDLESRKGGASADLEEMENAGFDESRMNVLVLAGGAARWHSERVGRATFLMEIGKEGHRYLEDDPPGANMGDPENLTWLIRFAQEHYPARRYALILWDHGGGPLDGLCLDEVFAPDRLTLAELSQALENAGMTEKLSWIGFDACLMSTVEIASSMAPWADYMIASQETEPPEGWNYRFLRDLADDPDPVEAARCIIDLYIDSVDGRGIPCTLACTDLSAVSDVTEEMDRYFSSLTDLEDPDTFSRLSGMRNQSAGFGRPVPGFGGSGYDLVDLHSLLSLYGENHDATKLEETLSRAVVYHRETEVAAGGLSVYHPYYNKTDYLDGWALTYRRLDFCAGYTDYILRFGNQLISADGGNWKALGEIHQEPDGQSGHLFSLKLTPKQQTGFLQAQLVILRPLDSRTAAAISGTAGVESKDRFFSPVAFAEAEIDGNGRLTAHCSDRSLYVLDENDQPVAGPLAWRLSDDGYICIQGEYRELTGRENAPENERVLFICEETENGEVQILRKEIYDPLTERYTARLSIREEDYSALFFDPLAMILWEHNTNPLPGLDKWGKTSMDSEWVSLSGSWRLQFLEETVSGSQLYASFEITDYWQNIVMAPLIPVDNQNLELIDQDTVSFWIVPDDQGSCDFFTDPEDLDPAETQDACITITEFIVADRSPMNPSILLGLELTHDGTEWLSFDIHNLIANEQMTLNWYDESLEALADVPPGITRRGFFRIPGDSLRGVKELTELNFDLEITTAQGNTLTLEVPCTELNYSLSGIAPEKKPALASASLEEIRLDLVELEEETDGSLTAVFHVDNHSESLFRAADWGIAVDGVISENQYAIGFALPGREGYCTWIFENRSSLFGLKVQWHEWGKQHLAVERILQASGISSVHSVQLLKPEADDSVCSLDFSLREPIPLKVTAEARTAEDLLLLDQEDIQVWAERVMIGDNGAGIRIRAVSHLDRPVLLYSGDKMIQWLEASNPAEEMMILPAGGTAYQCIHISSLNALPTNHIIDLLGLGFRWEDQRMTRAIIRFPDPAWLNDTGGIYMPASGMEVSPAALPEDKPDNILAQYDSPEITVQLLSLESGMHNELAGRLRLITHMDQDLTVFYSAMTVEDVRADAFFNVFTLPAAGTREITFLYDNAILDYGTVQEADVLQHRGIDTVSRLTFLIGTNYDREDAALTVPLVLEEPFQLPAAQAPAFPEP